MKNIIEVSFVNKLTYLTCADAVLNDWGFRVCFQQSFHINVSQAPIFFYFFACFLRIFTLTLCFHFFYFRTFGSVLCMTARLCAMIYDAKLLDLDVMIT